METRANHILIGIFTLAVVAAGFMFVWWFGARGDTAGRMVYRVVFEGSVSGLSRGSAVLFNGIRVGEVTGLNYDPQSPNKVVATIGVEARTPVRTDTTAQLEFQGLTGVSAVMLRGGKPEAPELKGSKENPPTIVAEPSQLQDILEGARSLIAKADDAVSTVQTVVKANAVPINQSMTNIQKFTDALASNSDAVGSFLASTGEAAKAITSLSGELSGLSTDARAIVRAVDPDKVKTAVDNIAAASQQFGRAGEVIDKANQVMSSVQEVVTAAKEPLTRSASNIEQFTGTLAKNSEALDALIASAGESSKALTSASNSVQSLAVDARTVVNAVDPEKVKVAVDGMSTFSQSLGRSAPQMEKLVADASALAESLRGTSGRLDGLLSRTDAVVAAIDPAKVGRAVDGVTNFADALNRNSQSVDQIVANARELSDRLNKASLQLDGLLTKADDLLGTANGSGVFDQVRDAAKSIRVLADNLDKRTATLSSDVSGFTGKGLRDLEGLISNGRQALAGVNQVVRDLQRNPQRFLFGSGGIPDYSSRR
jgi:phospholipid/cholesterol/gamma-HCH transport system substrate-binding protein